MASGMRFLESTTLPSVLLQVIAPRIPRYLHAMLCGISTLT
jgi:hypothetical protein